MIKKIIPLISLTSDFGVQTQGVGLMMGAALSIAPEANVIHLMHGLPPFDVTAAARTLETTRYLSIGYHVCVCDPGVGTFRKAIAIRVNRGDYLIGPDNGVLIPATRVLGGIERVHEITNPKYMRYPVSPIFHGRDIFAPTAAYLSKGIHLEEFGPNINPDKLVVAPYQEAIIQDNKIEAQVIQINRYGSIHLNILHENWDKFNLQLGEVVSVEFADEHKISIPYYSTFGNVSEGKDLILKDDYGRVEIATNLGSFVNKIPAQIGMTIKIFI